MSLDLCLYSTNVKIVSREDLVKVLLAKGWHIILSLVSEQNKLVSSGPIEDDIIFGARSAETIKRIAESLADKETLDTIFNDEKCGMCTVIVFSAL